MLSCLSLEAIDNPACPEPITNTVGCLSLYPFSKFLTSNQFGALKSLIF